MTGLTNNRNDNHPDATGKWNMGVDVIVRFHDSSRTHELDRALFSLLNQSFSPVHAIIVTQNFGQAERKTVEEVVEKFEWTPDHVSPTVVNVESEPGQDVRSKLLNVGIALGQNRFLAILDFDDYVYEHAYEFLIGELLLRNAVIVFGGIAVKHVRVFKDHVYNLRRISDAFCGSSFSDLLVGNFCPIHSFVIDRSFVTPADLYFEESLTRLEDYDFLLRICSKYSACFETRSRVIGVYNWHVDGTNCIQVFEIDEQIRLENAREWSQAQHYICRLKVRVRNRMCSLADPQLGKVLPNP